MLYGHNNRRLGIPLVVLLWYNIPKRASEGAPDARKPPPASMGGTLPPRTAPRKGVFRALSFVFRGHSAIPPVYIQLGTPQTATEDKGKDTEDTLMNEALRKQWVLGVSPPLTLSLYMHSDFFPERIVRGDF